ncbi:MAG: glycosyltransferase family 2 protein [Oscillatoriales cyanobacterium]|nr:MAG: glycosyltransferase family 2 protein [Oscillatoriales cyanobacterium]
MFPDLDIRPAKTVSSDPEFSITIAICTYNGATRLPQVLEALYRQTPPQAITWEVLIVDNNSTDDTATIVATYRQHWRDDVPLHYHFEPRQGTTYARQRAFREAHGTWVGLLDDDNIPPLDWLTQAIAFIQASTIERPQLGAFGGNIHPRFETEPPPEFDRFAQLLAVYDRGDRAFPYRRNVPNRIVPAAPGSFIRRCAWFETIPFDRLRLGGRDEFGGTFIGACEDLEALFYLQNSTWEIWHAPALYVLHHIPPQRCTRSYLIKIARTSGLSNHALRLARLGCDRHSEMLWRGLLYFIADGFKLLAHLWQTRKQPNQMMVACDRAAHLGRWLSPLIYSSIARMGRHHP